MIMHNVGGEIYIGQSKNVFTRWSKHYKEAMLNKKDDNSILHKAIRKYGIEAFYFKILELCSEDELDDKEKFYINLYGSMHSKSNKNFNYNIKAGGVGGASLGSKNGNAKLTEEDVWEIRERYKSLEKKKDVYKQYSNIVSINTFADVWTGKTWKHIHYDVYTNENKEYHKRNKDVSVHPRIVTDEEVINIRKYRAAGVKPKTIYNEFFSYMNRNTFNDVWYDHTFKEIKLEDDINEGRN